jgi:hypothetical protein
MEKNECDIEIGRRNNQEPTNPWGNDGMEWRMTQQKNGLIQKWQPKKGSKFIGKSH